MVINKRDIEYTLLQQHSAEHVELQFNGSLFNQPVVWQAHIRTLRDYCFYELAIPQQLDTVHAQAFIDINTHNNQYSLLVALNIPVIDDAAILRTIIMIRQYKRLQPGRHQYGDIATFNFDIK